MNMDKIVDEIYTKYNKIFKEKEFLWINAERL